MAISPPRWAPNAIPTLRGWMVGSELIVSRRHTQQELDEFFHIEEPAPVIQPDPEPVVEQPTVNLDSMTKAQLVEYANTNNIEVNPADLKATILDTIKQAQ